MIDAIVKRRSHRTLPRGPDTRAAQKAQSTRALGRSGARAKEHSGKRAHVCPAATSRQRIIRQLPNSALPVKVALGFPTQSLCALASCLGARAAVRSRPCRNRPPGSGHQELVTGGRSPGTGHRPLATARAMTVASVATHAAIDVDRNGRARPSATGHRGDSRRPARFLRSAGWSTQRKLLRQMRSYNAAGGGVSSP
jgi:hypothetical protein